MRYLLERGRAFNGIPRPNDPEAAAKREKARPFFLEAWELGRTAGADAYALDAAHMMAIIEPPAEALAWSEKAIAAAEASADPKARGWLGPLYNNTGWTYHDKGEYAKALELFEKGVAFRAERKQAAELRIAKWTVGCALRSLGRTAEALERQRALSAELEAAGEKDGFVFEELGECLLALGREGEAKPWFARAFEELSKDEWFAKTEATRLARLKDLGR